MYEYFSEYVSSKCGQIVLKNKRGQLKTFNSIKYLYSAH